ncbi:MAG TPA: anti-sigma factor [Nocardioides sp.]|nr:anti-sigma factor [Nocardioides sp.]
MSDIHALSGAYAVDALDEVERTEFEKHLAECAECRAEVQSFSETAAIVAEAEAQTPPPGLRARVMADISTVRPFPPETSTTQAVQPAEAARAASVVSLRRRTLPMLVAAAAAVVLVAAGALTWHPWQHDRATLAEQILHAPDAVQIVEKLPGGTGRITLVRSASLKRAVMVGDHVPDPGPGKTYQMWLQQPGRPMVSAGLMPDADQPTVLTGDAATAEAAAVSVEPETGSVHPSKHVVAVFPLSSTSRGNNST